jgi:hypothetical protein
MNDVLEHEDELLEDYESDFESDYSEDADERARRRTRARPARPKTPSGQGLYRTRPTNNAVTETQLRAALDRVGQQIKAGSTATQQLAARVNTVTERLDAEIAGRKKADVEQKKVVGQSSMNMMLPLLLMQGTPEADPATLKSIVLKVPDPTAPTDRAKDRDEVVKVFAEGTKFKSPDMMLPMVMMMAMGGMGGASGSPGAPGGYGGDNNMMMMMLMVMMMQKK